MRMPRSPALFAAVSMALSGCSKSDLDRCIDSQMAVWKQQQQSYEEQVKNFKPPYSDAEAAVNVGGLELDRNVLAYPQSPGTKEEAEAKANLRCGKIYARGD